MGAPSDSLSVLYLYGMHLQKFNIEKEGESESKVKLKRKNKIMGKKKGKIEGETKPICKSSIVFNEKREEERVLNFLLFSSTF